MIQSALRPETIQLPPLYAILDVGQVQTTSDLLVFAEELCAGGCTLLQYRNKNGNARVMLEQARELKGHLGEFRSFG